MRRDMDLVRDILLAVENADQDPRTWIDLSIPEKSNKEIAYHVMLLHQAGFLKLKN